LTPEEKRLYGQLFRIADSEQIGVITGAVAVEFFKKSRLSPAILAEVRLLQNDVDVDMDDCGYG
jgi:epidermal growth factor receptor substrate 15